MPYERNADSRADSFRGFPAARHVVSVDPCPSVIYASRRVDSIG
jgi:hypothetical protein